MRPDEQDALVATVEATLARALPDLEVWDVQVEPPRNLVRVLIDRPGGVDLEACEAATRALSDVRDRHALEVSSPGLERPLVRPSHYARAVGETVRLRLARPLDGRRRLEGVLAAADGERLRLVTTDGEIEVPLAAVARSNIVWNPVNA